MGAWWGLGKNPTSIVITVGLITFPNRVVGQIFCRITGADDLDDSYSPFKVLSSYVTPLQLNIAPPYILRR